MSSKILIVEDEAKLWDVRCDSFRNNREHPTGAQNGMQALSMALSRGNQRKVLAADRMESGEVILGHSTHRVFVGKREVPLNLKEFSLHPQSTAWTVIKNAGFAL